MTQFKVVTAVIRQQAGNPLHPGRIENRSCHLRPPPRCQKCDEWSGQKRGCRRIVAAARGAEHAARSMSSRPSPRKDRVAAAVDALPRVQRKSEVMGPPKVRSATAHGSESAPLERLRGVRGYPAAKSKSSICVSGEVMEAMISSRAASRSASLPRSAWMDGK